ncbi:thiamine-phosphate kinase [bacterium]|nr:thiamine-phosphate kinase [bacterium]
MKELEFLQIISEKLDNNSYIGDDTAFLEDLGIFVTQDTLVEDVHFLMHTTSPYLLGRKAVSVNLSDLAAALSIPKYISVSVSMPENTEKNFVSELYRGIKEVCDEFKVKVIGGDITGSNKIVISICAIGLKSCQYLSSRAYAKKDDYIITTGSYGKSSAGLYALTNFLMAEDTLIQAHLNPQAKINEALYISSLLEEDIATMDTSDGLIDAIYKISQASGHTIELDFNSIPVEKSVKDFSNRNNLNYQDFVLWGGEDYEVVFCVPKKVFEKLDSNKYKCIGRVQNKDNNPVVNIKTDGKKERITKEIFEKKSYNHFKRGH